MGRLAEDGVAMSVATRTEVGTCDLGNVFIFAVTSEDGKRWMVRAGNHTIGTYNTEEQAVSVARALVGAETTNEFRAEAGEPIPPAMEEVVKATRKKVSG